MFVDIRLWGVDRLKVDSIQVSATWRHHTESRDRKWQCACVKQYALSLSLSSSSVFSHSVKPESLTPATDPGAPGQAAVFTVWVQGLSEGLGGWVVVLELCTSSGAEPRWGEAQLQTSTLRAFSWRFERFGNAKLQKFKSAQISSCNMKFKFIKKFMYACNNVASVHNIMVSVKECDYCRISDSSSIHTNSPVTCYA